MMLFRNPPPKKNTAEVIEENTYFNLFSTDPGGPPRLFELGSNASSASSLQDVVLEGRLKKRSRHIQQWRHRWCVLTDRFLTCYKHQAKYNNPTESIDLRVFNNVKQSSASASRFKIYREGYGSFNFDCESPAQCKVWIKEIEHILKSNPRRISAAVSVKKRVQFNKEVGVKYQTPDQRPMKSKHKVPPLNIRTEEPMWFTLIPITDGLSEDHFCEIVGQRLIHKIRFDAKFSDLIEIKLDQHGHRWYKRRNTVLLREIPAVNVSVFGSEGPEFYRASELLNCPRCLVFTIPACFTPTSELHLPTYINNLRVFRENNIHVFCIATADPFCLNAFAQQTCPELDKTGITFVSDQSMALMNALKKTINLTYVGLGLRGARTAFYCENGKICRFWEDQDPFQISETCGGKIIEDLGLLNSNAFLLRSVG